MDVASHLTERRPDVCRGSPWQLSISVPAGRWDHARSAISFELFPTGAPHKSAGKWFPAISTGGQMDHDQVEVLYRDHGPAILRYLYRLVKDADIAQDLLHETFVAMLEWPHPLDELHCPKAWLYAVARRKGMNLLRRRKDVRPLLVDPPTEAEPQDPRLEDVREAVLSLPQSLRETLELRIQQDLSYQEIAIVLGIPLGTVRSRLHHAVRQLRRRLQDRRT